MSSTQELEKTVRTRLAYIGVKDNEYRISGGYVYYHDVMLHPVLKLVQISMNDLAADLDNLRRDYGIRKQ